MEIFLNPLEKAFVVELENGLNSAASGIYSNSRSPVSALFLLLYDCVGLGVKEIYFELRFNTEANIKKNEVNMGAAEAKWNPSFFLRDAKYSPIPIEPEFLGELESVYTRDAGLSDSEAMQRLWEVAAATVRMWKHSEPFKCKFPGSLVVAIGNGVGEGAEATISANGDSLPSDFWDGSML